MVGKKNKIKKPKKIKLLLCEGQAKLRLGGFESCKLGINKAQSV